MYPRDKLNQAVGKTPDNKMKKIKNRYLGLIFVLLALPTLLIIGLQSIGFAQNTTAAYSSNNSVITYAGQKYYKCISDTTTNLDTCDFGFTNSPTAAYGVPTPGSLASNTSTSVLYFNQTMVNKIEAYCNNNAGACSSSSSSVSSFSCSSFWSTFGTGSNFIVGGQNLTSLTSGLTAPSSTYNTTSGVYYYSSKPDTFPRKIGNSTTSVTSCLGPNQPSKTNSSTSSGQNISLTGFVGAAPVVTQATTTPVVPPANGGGTTAPAQPSVNTSCTVSGFFNLSWVICPIIDGISRAVAGFYNDILAKLLNIDSSQFIGSNSQFYQAWSNFRIIANIILVLILLIVVFGETIGGSLLDSYTIKKIVPRLVLMVILSNLSIYIVVGMIDVFNIIGKGIVALMTAPFSSLSISTSNFSGPVGFSAMIVGLFALDPLSYGFVGFILLFLLIPAILFLVATFVTLALRQIIIVFLLLVSPIAFILYILPNTDKYFKKWWQLLVKTLMVYPIVFAVYAISQIAAFSLFNYSGGGISSFIDKLMAIFAMLVPIFLIPFSFKLSGGLVGSTYGMLNKALKGERYKKTMAGLKQGQKEKYATKSAAGERFSEDRGLKKLNKAMNKVEQFRALAPRVGVNPSGARSRYDSLASQAQAVSREAAKKSPDLANIAGSSAMLSAGMIHGRDVKGIEKELENKFRRDNGIAPGADISPVQRRRIKQDAASVERAVKSVGENTFRRIAPGLKASTSDGYGVGEGGFAKMVEDTVIAAGGDRQTAQRDILENSAMAAAKNRHDLAPGAKVQLGSVDKVINELTDKNGKIIPGKSIFQTGQVSTQGNQMQQENAPGVISIPKAGGVNIAADINEAASENITATKMPQQMASVNPGTIEALSPYYVSTTEKLGQKLTGLRKTVQDSGVDMSKPDEMPADIQKIVSELRDTESSYIKHLATLASIYEATGASAPQTSQAFGDMVLSQEIESPLSGVKMKIKDLIEEAKRTQLYQLYKAQMMPMQNSGGQDQKPTDETGESDDGSAS